MLDRFVARRLTPEVGAQRDGVLRDAAGRDTGRVGAHRERRRLCRKGAEDDDPGVRGHGDHARRVLPQIEVPGGEAADVREPARRLFETAQLGVDEAVLE